MAIDRAKITKQAESYMASGKVDRAIDEFLKLLEDRTDDFNLMNRVGDAYLQSGKVADAVDMFKRAGLGFERGGFNAKASAVFKKAHRSVPDDVDVAARLADLYRQTNMIKEAIQIHIDVADVFTKKGLIKRALEEFAKVVELDPKNLKNKVKLADLYNKEGMKERAAGIYLEVAESLAFDQMHTEAYQILERAKTMISSPQVYLTQSRLCVIQKDLAGAAKHLREGLQANPRSTELLDALAEVEIQNRNPDLAMQALAEVPQLPEKSLQLCERALRDLAKSQRVEEGLRLFKPIGRELARRGLGESAAKSLKSALHGFFTSEAWLQLAEIAHQGGNKADQIDALRQGHREALIQQDPILADGIARQLTQLGFSADQLAAEPSPVRPPTPAQSQSQMLYAVDIDPLKSMQIQQLLREAETFLRSRYMDRALECLARVLELEPAHVDAINRIAEIHKASGVLTKVQMHYVRTAERLAPLGFKSLAAELLDKAEAMFPGSTRLYRRTLGLLDVAPPAPQVYAAPIPLSPPAPPPGAPALEALPLLPMDQAMADLGALPPPMPDTEDLALPFFAEDFNPLDLARPSFQPPPDPFGPPPALPALQDADHGGPMGFHGLPGEALPGPDYEPYPALESFSGAFHEPFPALEPEPEPEMLQWEIPAAAEPETARERLEPFPQLEPLEPLELEPLEPLELEPLSFTGFSEAPPAPPEVDEDLAATLSDIDFQLDYGSPDEAKIEIENALRSHPGHPELLHRLEQAEDSLRKLGIEHKAASLQDTDFTHSFFDLTDVLGDALLESGEGEEMHDATNVVEKIQSVDELFNAFREGVEQQVKGDDYDTHYNLGIAYKEMLLLDPAIEEFKKAMRDPERTLECCSMLSICEQIQGNLTSAEAWLRQGIQAPGFPPEDAIGLRYDLGEILQMMGRTAEAQEAYASVRDLDPDYREVSQKVH